MNAFYEVFPESIVINGSKYDVVTDFREWIKWIDMLSDKDLNAKEKSLLTLDMFYVYPEEPFETIANAMIDFLKGLPETIGSAEASEIHLKPKEKLLSYADDAKYIIPDFLNIYGIDLLDNNTFLHWWKFRLLLDGLPEETMTKKVIYYRSIDLNEIKDKDERSRMRKLKDSVKLPEERGVLSDSEIANAFC